ncbi:hypothetical protein [Chryseobacterium sp. Hurlbut01]|jgi:hypothetical protein|uniref:hypothetical protein n=1 Tax=Chryseobacterium sp. Hurlbut01 TaxID=1681828 RepID=UPI00067BD0E4|nr:hypothetical protein [Chryseobacterium sp. Hurlbut01]KNB61992.1 hypothetical protein AC804_03600 [Chryseobacterium sp. Hurlbut01]
MKKNIILILLSFIVISCYSNNDEVFINSFIKNNKIHLQNLSTTCINKNAVFSNLDKSLLEQNNFNSFTKDENCRLNINLIDFQKTDDMRIYAKISRPIFSRDKKKILIQVIKQDNSSYSDIIYLLRKADDNKWKIENEFGKSYLD